MLDFQSYLFLLARQNRLAKQLGFHPCLCSGMAGLEGVLESLQDHDRFICIDDTTDGHVEQLRSGGYFTTRVCTVFILARYDYADTRQCLDRLTECRKLFRQLHSRLILDEEQLHSESLYLDVNSIRYKDLGQYTADGLTGLFFMLTLREPTDLCFHAEEWDMSIHADTFTNQFTTKFD